MIILTVTTTKAETDPWITIDADGTLFTKAEQDNVIAPYLEFVNSLPGLVENGYSDTYEGNSHIITYKFESLEKMHDAFALMTGPDADPRATAKFALFKQKIDAAGIKYSSKSEVIDDSIPTTPPPTYAPVN
jgi:hypothetical protein